jgi:S1-C subfamily serine protease
MASIAKIIVRSLFSVVLPLVLGAAGCSTTYVRVPAVCPNDSYCLGGRGLPAADRDAREREFVRRTSASIVEVRASVYVPNAGMKERRTSGAVIGAKGYVLTSYHGVVGAERVTVVLRDADGTFPERAREIPMVPLVLSLDQDVGLLVPPLGERMPPPLPIRYDPAIVGDEVVFTGHGAALSRGRVVETTVGEGLTRDFADADLRMRPGDDGAPVLDVCGEVTGVMLYDDAKKRRGRYMPILPALLGLGVTPADLR